MGKGKWTAVMKWMGEHEWGATSIWLPRSMLQQLTELAARRKTNKSALMRELIDRELARAERRAAKAARP